MPPAPTSFADRIIASKGSLIHKLKAKDSTGEWAYYFLLVEAAKEQEFTKSVKEQTVSNLEAYGKIIASCYGEEPSDEVKQLLKEKYGFDV